MREPCDSLHEIREAESIVVISASGLQWPESFRAQLYNHLPVGKAEFPHVDIRGRKGQIRRGFHWADANKRYCMNFPANSPYRKNLHLINPKVLQENAGRML